MTEVTDKAHLPLPLGAALIIAIMPVLTVRFAAIAAAACQSEDGGSDRRRLSSELPSWLARFGFAGSGCSLDGDLLCRRCDLRPADILQGVG